MIRPAKILWISIPAVLCFAALLVLIPVLFDPRGVNAPSPSADRLQSAPPAAAVPPLQRIHFFNEIFNRFSSCSLPAAFRHPRFGIDLRSLRLAEGGKRLFEKNGKTVLAASGSRVSWIIRAKEKDLETFGWDRLEMEIRAAGPGELSIQAVARPSGLTGRLRTWIDEGIRRNVPEGRPLFQAALDAGEGGAFQTIAVPLDFPDGARPDGLLVRYIPEDEARSGFELRRLEVYNLASASYGGLPSAGYYKYGGTDRYRMKGVFVPAGSVLTYSLPLGSGPGGEVIAGGSLASAGRQPVTLTIRSGKARLVARTKGPEIVRFNSAFASSKSDRLDIVFEVEGPPGAVAVIGNLAFHRLFPREGRKNILLYLVDALRADLGGTGEELFRSRFADGTVFASAYANATFTACSVPALFTGRYAFTLIKKAGQIPNLSEDILLLAEYLKSKDYTTAAFINNPWLDHTRASQGFDFVFHCWGHSNETASPFPSPAFYAAAKYGEMAALLSRFVRENGDKPLFIYIHTMETHVPYEVPLGDRMYSAGADRRILEEIFQKFAKSPEYPALPEPTAAQLAVLKAQYKDAVRKAFHFFDKVDRDLEAADVLDSSSLRILTADHGERFFEHRSWIHGPPDMYEEVLRVPLMVRGGGFPPGVCGARVQLVDIFPTIVDWLGDSPPDGLPGRSLRDAAAQGDGSAGTDDRIVYADGQGAFPHYAFLAGSLKVWVKGGNIEVFDLEKDPRETVNLAGDARYRDIVKRARAFRRSLKNQPAESPDRLSEQERERLKSLGYVR